jgi:peptidoglycan/LPS O-acetylase OafA/YrhL
MVLVGHSYPLTGDPVEPLAAATGVLTLGTVAVHAFFAISGHLVTLSWLADPDVGRFVARRLLRILPALVIVVLLSVFALGPLATDRTTAAYFADGETWRYLTSALTWPVRYHLPGVFAQNPIAAVVNGSLWTLPMEMLMYAGIVVLGVAGVLGRPTWLAPLLALTCALGLLAWRLGETHATIVAEIDVRWLLVFAIAFLTGAMLAVADDRVPRSLALAAVALCVGVVLVHHPLLRVWAPIAIAYATVVAGTRPVEPLASVGAENDLSYGMYLYGYPLQQIAVAVVGRHVALAMAAAIVSSAGCAWLSWRLIEAPALRLKPARRMRGAQTIEPERSLFGASLRVGPSVPHDEGSDSCVGSPRSQP